MRRRGLLAAVAAVALAVPAAASAQPVVVADPGAGGVEDGALWRVDTGTGAAVRLLAPPLTDPVGVVRVEGGDLLVTDYRAGAPGRILRLDADTGAARVLVDGVPLADPKGIAVDRDGGVWLSDLSAFGASVLRLDPGTGAVTRVAAGAPLREPHDLFVESNGDVLVADGEALLRISPGGAVRTIAAGAALRRPFGLVALGDGTVVVAAAGAGQLTRVVASTGATSRLAAVVEPRGLALDADGRLLVTARAGLLRVVVGTGSVATLLGGAPLLDPYGVLPGDPPMALLPESARPQLAATPTPAPASTPAPSPAAAPPPAGTPPAPPVAGPPDIMPPVLSAVRVAPRRIRGAPPARAAQARRLVVRYRVSEPARVTFTLRRLASRRACRSRHRAGRRCGHYLRIRGRPLVQSARAGANRFLLSNRPNGRRLLAGPHRLYVRATDAAGNRSRVRRADFVVESP